MRILVIMLAPLRGITSSMMRAVGLVRGLRELGHEVDFLTTPGENQLIAMRAGRPLEGSGVRLMETGANRAYAALVSGKSGLKRRLAGLARRVYHALSLYDNTVRIARSLRLTDLKPAYDAVISVSDPKSSHVAVRRLKEQGLKAARWIQYWGDPMTLDITNKSRLPRFLYKREERRLLQGCDKVFYTNPFTLEKQRALFQDLASRMASTPTALSQDLVCAGAPGGPFRVSYIGAYKSHVRDLEPFYRACLRLGEGFETCIMGDSDLKLQGTERVRILPRGDAGEIERGTDLFICVLNRVGTQIPGKLYHYAASNRPILVILDGEEQGRIREYLDTFRRYVFCRNDEAAILEAILALREDAAPWGPPEAMRPRNVAAGLLAE